MVHLINMERSIYMNLHVWIWFAILTICFNLEIDLAHFWHFAFAFWYLLLTVTLLWFMWVSGSQPWLLHISVCFGGMLLVSFRTRWCPEITKLNKLSGDREPRHEYFLKTSRAILICSQDWEWLMAVSMCMYIIIRSAWWKYSSIMYLNIFWLTFWTAWWVCTKRFQNSLLATRFHESMMPFLNFSDGIAKSRVSHTQLLLIEGIGVFTLASAYFYLSVCTQI